MVKEYDYLVIGSGIAGMSFALKVVLSVFNGAAQENPGRGVFVIQLAAGDGKRIYADCGVLSGQSAESAVRMFAAACIKRSICSYDPAENRSGRSVLRLVAAADFGETFL